MDKIVVKKQVFTHRSLGSGDVAQCAMQGQRGHTRVGQEAEGCEEKTWARALSVVSAEGTKKVG